MHARQRKMDDRLASQPWLRPKIVRITITRNGMKQRTDERKKSVFRKHKTCIKTTTASTAAIHFIIILEQLLCDDSTHTLRCNFRGVRYDSTWSKFNSFACGQHCLSENQSIFRAPSDWQTDMRFHRSRLNAPTAHGHKMPASVSVSQSMRCHSRPVFVFVIECQKRLSRDWTQHTITTECVSIGGTHMLLPPI